MAAQCLSSAIVPEHRQAAGAPLKGRPELLEQGRPKGAKNRRTLLREAEAKAGKLRDPSEIFDTLYMIEVAASYFFRRALEPRKGRKAEQIDQDYRDAAQQPRNFSDQSRQCDGGVRRLKTFRMSMREAKRPNYKLMAPLYATALCAFVTAGSLVNGTTIDYANKQSEYFHIELPIYDAVYAAGPTVRELYRAADGNGIAQQSPAHGVAFTQCGRAVVGYPPPS